MNEHALIPYSDLDKMAAQVVESRLFPVKSKAEAMTLFLLCQAEGLHPMRALRMFDIIQGRPAIKPKALMASLIERGGRVEWKQNDENACIGKFFGKGCPEGVEVKFDVEDAKKAGLLNKPGPWQQYRADMLRHRCTGRGVDMVDPGAAFGLYSTPVTQDIVEEQAPEVREKADAEIMASTGQDIEEKPLSAVLGVSKVNVAGAMVKMAGFKCELCSSQIAQFPSEAKDTPGRLYWMCETAHAEQLKRRLQGETIAKAKAAIKGHFGCASRQWAEVWPRTNGGAGTVSETPTSEPTSSAPPVSLEAEVERLKAKRAAAPFRQPEVHEQIQKSAEKIADEVHQMGGSVEEQLEEIKRRVGAGNQPGRAE